MSIQSLSFWQQDANYWNRSQQRDQSIANTDSLITTMGSIVTNESSGLSSIANQTALNRVNTALTAAIQNELQQTTSGNSTSSNSTSSSTSASSSSSSSAAPAPANATSSTGAPATGTGTVPLSANTSLLTLGIPDEGAIVVSDGTNATTYKSTGTDTVANLLTALNANVFGNAQVNAYLNGSGNLVITGKNTSDTISVTGLFAGNLGFGAGNQTFLPTPPSSSAAGSSGNTGTSSNSGSSTASSASSTSSTNGSSTSSTSNPITAGLFNSAGALQTGATAEFLLGSTGSTGSLVNLLA